MNTNPQTQFPPPSDFEFADLDLVFSNPVNPSTDTDDFIHGLFNGNSNSQPAITSPTGNQESQSSQTPFFTSCFGQGTLSPHSHHDDLKVAPYMTQQAGDFVVVGGDPPLNATSPLSPQSIYSPSGTASVSSSTMESSPVTMRRDSFVEAESILGTDDDTPLTSPYGGDTVMSHQGAGQPFAHIQPRQQHQQQQQHRQQQLGSGPYVKIKTQPQQNGYGFWPQFLKLNFIDHYFLHDKNSNP